MMVLLDLGFGFLAFCFISIRFLLSGMISIAYTA